MDFDAVVLAGGRGSRLGGADKASLEVDGVALLDRALAALAGARHVVVVGEEHPTSREVRWVREDPAYGGPVAATYAGRDALPDARLLVVLAVDMPAVTASTVGRLLDAVGEGSAVLTAGGREHLAMAVTTAALDSVRPDPTSGAAMRELWSRLDHVAVAAEGDEAFDVDSPTDLAPEGLKVRRGRA